MTGADAPNAEKRMRWRSRAFRAPISAPFRSIRPLLASRTGIALEILLVVAIVIRAAG